MLSFLREGDVVIVYKTDRIFRSLKNMIELIEFFNQKGVFFKSISEPAFDTTSANGKFIIQIFGAVAEFERNLISERTKAGIEGARRRKKLIGRPKGIKKETLEKYGVDTRYIKSCHEKSGHAVIQVEDGGQNSILLYGGANQVMTEEYVDEVLKNFAGEMLLLQNEINEMPYIMRKAKELGCQVYFNAAPMNKKVFDY